MLQPDTNWYWFYDSHYGCLSLSMGEMQFTTPYAYKMLNRPPVRAAEFDLQDLEHYSLISRELELTGISLSGAQKTQLALNACAALRFHKPLMPKSWFFKRHRHNGHYHHLAYLSTETDDVRVWVIEEKSSSCLCMLLDDDIQLQEGKTLQQFGLIRVTPDCILPCMETTPHLKTA
ncbi:cell division protein ZapC domain-containing protein [Lacimicrobium alkaliphilum]|uniref:Cell division protein ZapC n=1 Tax=Lacimicrobium alkaliphilum TaxID=1526571 RepID=A0ABQ1R123_9ALTE|nr:cell division protein ZapC domain-containing protein [Lacimicrobium alkaliphilum]GGD52457.1 cell division protein ZapC [Lacimicrobium alkaliphilum]